MNKIRKGSHELCELMFRAGLGDRNNGRLACFHSDPDDGVLMSVPNRGRKLEAVSPTIDLIAPLQMETHAQTFLIPRQNNLELHQILPRSVSAIS